LHKLCCTFVVVFIDLLKLDVNSTWKNIRIMILLLAGLIILLHSTIPHNHHIDSFSYHSDNCFTQETSPESSDEAKLHCHAFNNIVTEKINSITFNSKSDLTFILFFISSSGNIQADNEFELSTFFTYNIVLHKQYFSTELAPRGPPSLV